MGDGKKGWSIERINNNGNYEPYNCCWATQVRQRRNMRLNMVLTVRGVTACVAELCEKFGGNRYLIYKRIHAGWSAERAFSEPSRRPSNG